jgi:methionine-rich copper-binding protein CopC
MIMASRLFSSTGLAGFVLLLLLQGVWADALRIVKSRPAAGEVIDGTSNEFEIMFDGLVNVRQSGMRLNRDGQAVAILHPSLSATSGVLYGRGPVLEPGAYTLHWIAKSATGVVTEGHIPFTVR